MIRKKKVIFVPGFTGIDQDSWPEWLGQELKKCGFEFQLMSMPDPSYPEVDKWLNHLNNQNFKIDSDTYFVGHSLGCITIARFLEKLPARAVSGGCIMVAGFCSLPKLPFLSNFCTLPLDFSEVKKHCREFVVVSSDNDHFIPRSSSDELALKLGAKIIIEPGKGHFKDNAKEVHSVLNTILEWDQMREEMKEIKKLKTLN